MGSEMCIRDSYDMYRYPEKLPPYDLGTLDFWWFDEAAYNDLKAKGAF